jgi:hypothetical protein
MVHYILRLVRLTFLFILVILKICLSLKCFGTINALTKIDA